jgi:hypothetical protein
MNRVASVLVLLSMGVMVVDVEAGLFGRRRGGGSCSTSGGCGTSSCSTGSSCGVGGDPVTFEEVRPDSLSSTNVRAARVSEPRQTQVVAASSPGTLKWVIAPSRLAQKESLVKRDNLQLPNLDAPAKTPAVIALLPDLDAPTGRATVVGNIAQLLPDLR